MKKESRHMWDGNVLITPIIRAIESERYAGNVPEHLSMSLETKDIISARTPNGWDGKDFHGISVILVDAMKLGEWQLTSEIAGKKV